ncbi:MAG: V-type ATP synthase subunit F [Thermococci archaeon]|nr:V-type ATP synthase subunit F [Thermococci archaeon]
MKIAVVGDTDTVLGFKLAGVHETFEVSSPSEAREVLNELVGREDIALILITDSLASELELPDVRLPIILTVPDRWSEGKGEARLMEIVRRAIGVEIKR